MAIPASSAGSGNFSPIEAGNYPARCIQMVHIGTVEETILGAIKHLNKVRISWELPTELKEYKEGEGEKPAIISKEFTLSLSDRANLRKGLASWRGKDFTEEEAKLFDVSKLIEKTCLINVIHKTSKDGSKVYAEIGSISPLPKGMVCDPQITPSKIFSYDPFDQSVFDSLPDFLKDKIKTSDEYRAMAAPHDSNFQTTFTEDDGEWDLPF